jgi:hypothetical protein
MFIAQHATATCCWAASRNGTGIGKGQAQRPTELTHEAAVIERWLRKQSVAMPEETAQGRLL